MKICRDCKKEFDLDNFYISKKSGSWPNCKQCVKPKRKARYEENKPFIAQQMKQYAETHKKEISKYQDQYYLDNYEKLRAQSNQYGKEHRDILNRAQRKWTKAHPDKKLAAVRKRQAAKLNRTPKWLTKADYIEMEWAYSIAKQLTQETGIRHVVDHIIPLRGKNISGLHCPQNLQVITQKENLQKHNKFPYTKEK